MYSDGPNDLLCEWGEAEEERWMNSGRQKQTRSLDGNQRDSGGPGETTDSGSTTDKAALTEDELLPNRSFTHIMDKRSPYLC